LRKPPRFQRAIAEAVERRVLLSIAYQVTDLGTLGGATTARAINDAGQITGYSEDKSGNEHAFIWQNGIMRDLGTLPGFPQSQGLAINDQGDVAGLVLRPNDQAPFVSIGGVISRVPLPASIVPGDIDGINAAGEIVGTDYSGQAAAFTFSKGKLTNLMAALGSPVSYAVAVNDAGAVTGYLVDPASGVTEGFIYYNGKVTRLQETAGYETRPNAINSLGDVVGRVGGESPFLYKDGKFIRIGPLSSVFTGQLTEAQALNDADEIVGYGTVSTALGYENAWVWRKGGSVIDLNSLINPSLGITLEGANSINNEGQILCSGGTAANRYSHSYLLTPTTAATVSGIVFDDHNGNGARGAGEEGIAGRTVFIDGNKNGVLDPGEFSTVTDAGGRYTFANLAPGSYAIRLTASGAFNQTTPPLTLRLSAGQSVIAPAIGLHRFVFYGVTDLSAFGDDVMAAAINNLGQVVGSFQTPAGATHPFLFGGGHFTDLGVFGASGINANDINDSGQILIDSGPQNSPVPANDRSYVIQGGKIQKTFPYTLYLLNNTSDVFGWNFFIDAGGKVHPVDVDGNNSGVAIDSANDRGDVAGETGYGSNKGPASYYPFALIGGKIVHLTDGSDAPVVTAINNWGTVVGSGFLYRRGVLGEFAAIDSPTDMNDAGQIVGLNAPAVYPYTPTEAMLYLGGRLIDLNDAVPYGSGLHLDNAVKINNAGQILVQASDQNGATHWLLLQPQHASISGSVFNDVNHDGVRESGEGPRAGVRVYVDLNHNGAYDVGEPTAITNSAGDYAIFGLNGGTYVVRMATPSGWFQTAPANSAATISLDAGDNRMLAPFGQAVLPPRTYAPPKRGPSLAPLPAGVEPLAAALL
jgi:probable HAF family extracellular repeat protein